MTTVSAAASVCGAGSAVAVAQLGKPGGSLVVVTPSGQHAAGYRVFAINPKAVDRYRDRYAVSGAKSDRVDAVVLANLLRTDRDRHRPLPDDTHEVEAIAVLARAHQDAIWTGRRDANRLRSLLREFFPAAVTAFPNLTTRSALTILAAAPTPAAARALTAEQIRQLLRDAGRVGVRASEVERLHRTFAVEQLHQPAAVEDAMGEAVRAIVITLTATQTAIDGLQTALAARFDNHPDAEILRSLPGLGVVLGGRVLGEFGDDPTRFTDAASRRRYAGTAPITRASGKSRVVLLRRARNQRLAEACRWWAFNAMRHSAGTMAYYRRRRAAGDTHEAALRRLGSKLVGQLQHCLEHREPYREDIAWPTPAMDQPTQPGRTGQPTAA